MRKCFILLFVLGACSPGKNISGFDGPLKEGNILDINRKVIAQQFDMDRRGNAYYAQIDPPDYYGVSIFRVDRDSLNRDSVAAPCPGQRMTLLYAGHPTGMAVEDAKDGPYIWIGNYASKVRSKSYWHLIFAALIEPFVYHPFVSYCANVGYFQYIKGTTAVWKPIARKGVQKKKT